MITTRPLTERFGVEITALPLTDVSADPPCFERRGLFETNSALLFRGRGVTDETHLRLARLFGQLKDRIPEAAKDLVAYEIPKVSAVQEDGSTSDEMAPKTLNLKVNFVWHADGIFSRVTALTNILIGRVVTATGGATELPSTRASWAAMPEALRTRINDRGVWHRYSHSRAKISSELAKLLMFHKWPDTHCTRVWTNPVKGKEAFCLASRAFKLKGISKTESQALIDDAINFCTQPQFVCSHHWQVGNVLIWNQRSVLEWSTPRNYGEPCTLSSIYSSVTAADVVDEVWLRS